MPAAKGSARTPLGPVKVLGFFYVTSEYLLQRKLPNKKLFFIKIPKKSLLFFLSLESNIVQIHLSSYISISYNTELSFF